MTRKKASFHVIPIIRTKNFNEAISITVDLMFRLKVKIRIINVSNCTLYIVKFFIGSDILFLADFSEDFQNEAARLCINNSINNDVK